jgi:Kef-type K+ transport system membrane component KefB
MQNIFLEITVIVCLAAVLSVFFKFFRQPIILAYILTGIIIGNLGFFPANNNAFLQPLSDIGITFLLFLMGIEIKIKEFFLIGKTVFLVGVGQMLLTFILGFPLVVFFGFDLTTSIYMTIALVFSSTVIGIKLLSDKKDLNSLYGKIAVGGLLMQDFLEIMVLIFLSTAGTNIDSSPMMQFLIVGFKCILLFGSIGYLSFNIFPKIIEKLSGSSEILFLVSIAWLFGLSAFISSPLIGFPISIGGFLAGLALTNSLANYQIIAKARTLRDFFIILFFVVLGINMDFSSLPSIVVPAIVLSAFVLLIKPLIIIVILGLLGFRKRTSFMSGTILAQISEFSLIIIFLAHKAYNLPSSTLSLITLVGIITFVLSSYVVVNNNSIFLKLSKYLSVFEKKNAHEEKLIIGADGFDDLKDHMVIVGGDQMGQSIVDSLSNDDKCVVVDFDPSIVKKLEGKENIYKLFGDIGDVDIQQKAKLDMASLVISTIPDVEDNILLLRALKHENRKAKVVVMAYDKHEARELYKEGADYVVLPHLAGGRQLAKILGKDLEGISSLKLKDQRYL